MTREFCDRCKKEITGTNLGTPIEYLPIVGSNKSRRIDLCYRCAEEFKNFLNGYSVDAVGD